MEIKKVMTDQIKFYANNPKQHPREQLDKIKRSITEFGFINPVLLDKDNNIIAGHGRYLASKELNLTEIPCMYIEHLNPAQIQAYRIADNKTAESDWANDFLIKELEALKQENYDLSLTGFTDKELAELLPNPLEDKEEEELPPYKPKYDIKRGQVWQLGNHRLMCGDSTNKEDVDKLMGGEKADMCFTSPPYNLGISAQLRGNSQISKQGNVYNNYNDNQDEDKWLHLMNESTKISLNYSEYVFINVQTLAGNRTALPRWWANFSNEYCDVAIWDKQHGVPQQALRVMNSRFEFIFILTKNNPNRAIRIAPEFRGTIDNVYEGLSQHKNDASKIHGATFPLHLPEYFINKFTQNSMKILDNFGGSGSTLIACENLGRKCFMMELDTQYVDTIIQRWERFTGKEAQLISIEVLNG